MSYVAAPALQGAIYALLRADTAISDQVGDAIYDAMPVQMPSGVYIALGAEEVEDEGDMTGRGCRHDFVVSVLTGSEANTGFGVVKAVAANVCDCIENAAANGQVDPGPGADLVGIWFQKARAKRVESGAGRRVDLTFRARIDLG